MSNLAIFDSDIVQGLVQPSFINYITLVGKNAKILNVPGIRATGITPGVFILNNKDRKRCIMLGKIGIEPDNEEHGSLECTLGPAMPKAMRFEGDNLTEISYNPNDDVFRKIKNDFDSKAEKNIPNMACNYGYEHLLFINPDQINFDSIMDKEFQTEAQATFKNGIIATFFWSRHSAKYAPILKKIKPLSKVAIKSSLIPAGNPYWACNLVDIINQDTLDESTMKLLTSKVEEFKNLKNVAAQVIEKADTNTNLER